METSRVRGQQNSEAIATLRLKGQKKEAVLSDPSAIRDIRASQNPVQKREGRREGTALALLLAPTFLQFLSTDQDQLET